MSLIYFDNNATTHIDPLVADRMHELNLEGVSNPASQHQAGRRALELLEDAKADVLRSVGVDARHYRVILTSGGTEANNLAIFGFLARRPGVAIVGGTDHPSILDAASHATRHGNKCRVLPVDSNGICDLATLETWIGDIHAGGESVSVVSVMLGNNETGVIQDLKSICTICKKFDVPVHSDVVQAVGKVPVDMPDLGLTALTLTAHKIHGPVGIGALITTESAAIDPVMIGGGQQLGMRAGTEPVIPAVGLAESLNQICGALENGDYQRLETLRDEFETRLLQSCNVSVVAKDAPRLPHTSNLSFLGLDRQALHMALDLKGIACSTGSACSSGSGRPSGSLVAMGLPEDAVKGSLRFSFSRFSNRDEILSGADTIVEAVAKSKQPA